MWPSPTIEKATAGSARSPAQHAALDTEDHPQHRGERDRASAPYVVDVDDRPDHRAQRMAASATNTVARASRTSQRRTPAPTLGTPVARSPLTSRATAICNAGARNHEDDVRRHQHRERPVSRGAQQPREDDRKTSASTFAAITAAPMPAARPVSERLSSASSRRGWRDPRRVTAGARTAPDYPRRADSDVAAEARRVSIAAPWKTW